jgi:hypothetical protein
MGKITLLYLPQLPERREGLARDMATVFSAYGFDVIVVGSHSEYLSLGIQGFDCVVGDVRFNHDGPKDSYRFENFKKRDPKTVIAYGECWDDRRIFHHKADSYVSQEDDNPRQLAENIVVRLKQYNHSPGKNPEPGRVIYYKQAVDLQISEAPFVPYEPTGATPYGRHSKPSAGTATDQMALSFLEIKRGLAARAAALIAAAEKSGDPDAMKAAEEEAKKMLKPGKAVVLAHNRIAIIGKSRLAGFRR